MKGSMFTALIAYLAILLAGSWLWASPAVADTVKITPLGSHDGEFCRFDRAMLFEDPDGIRLEANFVPGKGLLA